MCLLQKILRFASFGSNGLTCSTTEFFMSDAPLSYVHDVIKGSWAIRSLSGLWSGLELICRGGAAKASGSKADGEPRLGFSLAPEDAYRAHFTQVKSDQGHAEVDETQLKISPKRPKADSAVILCPRWREGQGRRIYAVLKTMSSSSKTDVHAGVSPFKMDRSSAWNAKRFVRS